MWGTNNRKLKPQSSKLLFRITVNLSWAKREIQIKHGFGLTMFELMV